ncbi:hypothetical protein D3C77_441310 [compost metagenome]
MADNGQQLPSLMLRREHFEHAASHMLNLIQSVRARRLAQWAEYLPYIQCPQGTGGPTIQDVLEHTGRSLDELKVIFDDWWQSNVALLIIDEAQTQAICGDIDPLKSQAAEWRRELVPINTRQLVNGSQSTLQHLAEATARLESLWSQCQPLITEAMELSNPPTLAQLLALVGSEPGDCRGLCEASWQEVIAIGIVEDTFLIASEELKRPVIHVETFERSNAAI